MSRGRRYNHEPKLNIKKVIAVIIAFIVLIMFIIAIKNLLSSDSSTSNLVSKSYFLFNKDNKWGVIDNNARVIIEPTYEDALVIPDSKKDIFICTYNVNYEKGTYETKVLNSKGKELFTEYDKVVALENYDENNNLWYEENVLLVEKDGKFGLINFNGDKLLDTVFDKIYTLKGTKNSLITEKNSKKGIVDHLGLEAVENKYDEIISLGKDTKKYIVKLNDKYGIKGILDCKYQEIKPLNNIDTFLVKENGKSKVIDKDEKVVFSEKFDSIETIKDNIIVYKYKDKYCAYDLKDNAKLSKTYKTLKYTSENLFIYRTSNNYGIIDIDGKTIIKELYANINYYEDAQIYELEEKNGDLNIILNNELKEIAKGIVNEVNYYKSYIKIWTEEGYNYYNLKGEKVTSKDVLTANNLFLSKQNGKYGFVDKEGTVVVDYIYDDAKEQNEFGYISVKKDGLWGSLNKAGQVLVETKYNLDNNLLIDFIGEYHLGEDINLMYYTNKD